MNYLRTLLILLIVILATDCQSSEKGLSWISVDGNKLVNEEGETVIFKGVNIRDPHQLEKESLWTRELFREAADWGANMIRLTIHPVAWKARGEEAYLQLLDSAVQWAEDLQLYLILDWHSIGNLKEEKFQHKMYVCTLEETTAFWSTMAEHFRDESAIALYELYNEPVSGDKFGECSWEDWKVINEELIRVVRDIHPRSVIGVAGFNWAYDLQPVATDPIEAEGIAYISHPYPQKRDAPWPEKWQADWGFVAEKYPVLLTEVGFALPGEKGVHVPVTGDETYGEALVDFCDERGISWMVWCFDAKWSPLMFTDYDNYTPTRQGVFFREAMSVD